MNIDDHIEEILRSDGRKRSDFNYQFGKNKKIAPPLDSFMKFFKFKKEEKEYMAMMRQKKKIKAQIEGRKNKKNDNNFDDDDEDWDKPLEF